MAEEEKKSGELQNTPLKRFNLTLTDPKTKDYLSEVLGKKASAYVNNIAALVSNDKKLQECEPITLIMAGIKATALDLPLDNNLGFAYVIPYKNNREQITVAQFQIGYKGFIQLAIRSGLFKHINTTDVRQGEITGEDFLSGENTYKRLPKGEREKAPVIGYVAYMELYTGFRKSRYMTVEEIKAHANQFSKTYKQGYGIWVDNEEAMFLKTPLKLLLSKYAPMSIEIQNAIKLDQAVITDFDGEPKYLDNEPDMTEAQQRFANGMGEKLSGITKDVPPTEFTEVKQ